MSIPIKDVPGAHLHSLVPSEAANAEISPIQESLISAIHSRRDEFTRSQHVRIKVGTWNVAACKDTDKDIGAWFVGGKGVAEELAGLSVSGSSQPHARKLEQNDTTQGRESIAHQEERYTPNNATIPLEDHSVVPGDGSIGIYALGIQELVDINSASEALRPFTDPSPANRFKQAIEDALPAGYTLVAEQQLIGLLLLIYSSPEVLPHVSSVSTNSVGTGLMGYMGNKGAVTARIVLGETTRLVFINCHMSAGTSKTDLERRNWDAAQIISRTRFDPITDSMGIVQEHGKRIGDEDLAFWFGDLNYRLEGIPGDDVRRILLLHTRNEYDISQRQKSEIDNEIMQSTPFAKARQNLNLDLHYSDSPSEHSGSLQRSPVAWSSDQRSLSSTNTLDNLDDEFAPELDPTSLQTTLMSLLAHDELHLQQKAHKAFADGWREGQITFMPTYKYDRGSVGMFDTSEKKRSPSWCDRILYRTRNDKLAYERLLKDREYSQKRDQQMKAQGLDKAADDETTLFEYDPDADGDGDDENEESNDHDGPTPLEVHTKEGFDDTIVLEHYVAHQRVLSSDHKPLDAVFNLKFDTIVPELRAKVHHEVVRELDKAENEGRPTITVVIEGEMDGDKIGPNGANFGKLRYGEPKTQHITLANTGLVRTRFGFVDGLEEETSTTTPDWLEIEVDHVPDKDGVEQAGPGDLGKTFTLEPGDTCDVKLTAFIEKMPLVRDLNEGKCLDDILILRIHGGRDHFIAVRGLWQRTSNGSTIDKLIRLPEGGVRHLQFQESKVPNKPNSKNASDENSVKWSAPREIFRLTEGIEALVERIIAEWSILSDELQQHKRPPWQVFAGWPFEISCWTLPADGRAALRLEVFEALDSNQSFDEHLPQNLPRLHRLEVLVESLLIFLRNLKDGVVPESLWLHLEEFYFTKENITAKSSIEDRRAGILECLSLSPNHSVAFLFLTAMLSRVAKEVIVSMDELPPATKAGLELKISDDFKGRKKSLGHGHGKPYQQLVHQSYATLFAGVMIRVPTSSSKWKMKRAIDERPTEIIETFLDTDP